MLSAIWAFLGSSAVGLTFNIKGYKLAFAGLSGSVGWITYIITYSISGYPIFSVFMGSIAVGLYSEIAARVLKSPSTVFSIPGILPLVPGIAAYETIQLLVNKEFNEALLKSIETAEAAGAIAFGIMLVTAGFRLASRKKSR